MKMELCALFLHPFLNPPCRESHLSRWVALLVQSYVPNTASLVVFVVVTRIIRSCYMIRHV